MSKGKVLFKIYLYNNHMDNEIKKYLLSEEFISKATIAKKVLRSFILCESPFKYNSLCITELPEKIALSISASEQDIIFHWYKKYIEKNINKNGALKNVLYYQIFGRLSDNYINIDILRDTSFPSMSQSQKEITKITKVTEQNLNKSNKEKEKDAFLDNNVYQLF